MPLKIPSPTGNIMTAPIPESTVKPTAVPPTRMAEPMATPAANNPRPRTRPAVVPPRMWWPPSSPRRRRTLLGRLHGHRRSRRYRRRFGWAEEYLSEDRCEPLPVVSRGTRSLETPGRGRCGLGGKGIRMDPLIFPSHDGSHLRFASH